MCLNIIEKRRGGVKFRIRSHAKVGFFFFFEGASRSVLCPMCQQWKKKK